MIVIEPSKGDYVKLDFPYSDYYVQAIKAIVPGTRRFYSGADHAWFVGADYIQKLVNELGAYNFASADPQIRAMLSGDDGSHRAEVQERLRNVTPLRSMDGIGLKGTPYPHQIEGFNYAISMPKLLIGDEPGLGKSQVSIATAVWRKSRSLIRKCLIVCCVNSTKYNWQAEIKKHSSEDSVIFDQSSPEKRLEAIKEWANNDVLFGIINIEALRPKNVNNYQMACVLKNKMRPSSLPMNPCMDALNHIANMVIVDEIHKCKTPKSQQGIALRQLSMPYRLALSGTPMTNKVVDLWNILVWLGAYSGNYWEFRDHFCVMGGFQGKVIVGNKNLPELNSILSGVMLRRRKDEVLDLPPKTHEVSYVELTKKERTRYRAAESGVIKMLLDEHGNLKVKNSQSALTTILRLRQVTGGYDIDADKPLPESDNVKLQRVREILDDEIIANSKKALIFSEWETITALYRDALKDLNPAYIVGAVSPEDRQKEVDRFQTDPNCKVAIGTIGAMGTGLTMTAAEYVIFIDKDWAQTNNEQAADRAYRIGTTRNVTVISMVAKDTIDERVENALSEKEQVFSQAVDGRSGIAAAASETTKKTLTYLLGVDDAF